MQEKKKPLSVKIELEFPFEWGKDSGFVSEIELSGPRVNILKT